MYPVKKTIIKPVTPHKFPKPPQVQVISMRKWINESFEKNSLPKEMVKKENISREQVIQGEKNDFKKMNIEDEIFDFA